MTDHSSLCDSGSFLMLLKIIMTTNVTFSLIHSSMYVRLLRAGNKKVLILRLYSPPVFYTTYAFYLALLSQALNIWLSILYIN